MNDPKIEYNIYDVYEFFSKETEKVKQQMIADVASGDIDKIKAREKYDMYLSMMIYLQVCIGLANDEKYLDDNSFSMKHLYAKQEKESSGATKLRKALEKM